MATKWHRDQRNNHAQRQRGEEIFADAEEQRHRKENHDGNQSDGEAIRN